MPVPKKVMKDDPIKRKAHEIKAYKWSAGQGAIGGLSAFTKGKTRTGLAIASIGLGLKNLQETFRAAKHSDTPLATSLKVNLLSAPVQIAGAAVGAVGGGLALKSLMKLRGFTMKRAASEAARFKKATYAPSTTLKSTVQKPAGKFVFRRVRVCAGDDHAQTTKEIILVDPGALRGG